MNKQPLLKYKIGLAMVAAFSLIFLVVVLAQAGGVKQDNDTYKKADKIATKLQSYTDTTGKVPNTLAAAGIKDVPDTVTYTKFSSTSYKFCVTYNSSGTGLDTTYLETQLFTGGHASDYYSRDSGDTSYLYVNPYHKKGENCQTIKIYNYNNYGYPDPLQDNTTPLLN